MPDQADDKKLYKDDLIRGLYLILFLVLSRVVSICVALIAVFQLVCSLVLRKPNENAKRFGNDLSIYLAEIVQFLSYNTDNKPWPFSSWPKAGPVNPTIEKSKPGGDLP